MSEPNTNNVAQSGQSLDGLQSQLGYSFQQSSHLQTALCHSSFAFEQTHGIQENNEVLEFVGDAVLDLAVGEILFTTFPNVREGELTRMRAFLVNEASLASLARDLDLGAYIALGKGEEGTGGRDKPSILACAYEAVIGAVFVDGGYEAARKIVFRQFSSLISRGKQTMLEADAKSRLQEMVQAQFGEAPTYYLEKEEGPDHQKVFTVSVQFQGRTHAVATATNKKEAEQRAAALAIDGFEDT